MSVYQNEKNGLLAVSSASKINKATSKPLRELSHYLRQRIQQYLPRISRKTRIAEKPANSRLAGTVITVDDCEPFSIWSCHKYCSQ